jgi:hypothetical protein
VVVAEDSQVVASGAAEAVHSSLSPTGSWLQLHYFVTVVVPAFELH